MKTLLQWEKMRVEGKKSMRERDQSAELHIEGSSSKRAATDQPDADNAVHKSSIFFTLGL